MSSNEPSLVLNSSRLDTLLRLTKGVYTRVKHSHSLIETSCSRFEPIFSSAASRLTTAGQSASLMLTSSVSTCLQVKVSLSEKKELYKASVLAWFQSKPKNLSDFLSALKKLSPKWSDSYEKLAEEFYYKSLQYHPRKALKLLADILSDGSETFKSALTSAKKSGISSFLTNLKENLGDKWNESFAEAGKVYKSLWKAKEKLILDQSFTQDWRSKARKSAEMATVLIFTGADELYFWSIKNVSESYATLFKDLASVLPFQGFFLSIVHKVQAFDRQELLELTWPEDVKTSFVPFARRLGFEEWLEKNWNYLDCDEDGIVTVEDICAAVTLVACGSFHAAMKVLNFRRYLLKNGEEA
jgi:hypothetical protein